MTGNITVIDSFIYSNHVWNLPEQAVFTTPPGTSTPDQGGCVASGNLPIGRGGRAFTPGHHLSQHETQSDLQLTLPVS